MKCKPCWAVCGVLVAIYAGDVIYPDWQKHECLSREIGGIRALPPSSEEIDKLKGRSFQAPKVADCKLIPENAVRKFFE